MILTLITHASKVLNERIVTILTLITHASKVLIEYFNSPLPSRHSLSLPSFFITLAFTTALYIHPFDS